jgi:Dolichyl-phosphate-mannose-protein mannosyltransferase
MGASASNLTRRLGRTELALAGILLVGAALRLWLILAWRPAFVGYPDSTTYLYAAQASSHGLLFYNDFRPAGYPLFLVWLHAIYANLTFVIVIQHVMGLLAAVLLYLTVVRFTNRRWVALIPAAVLALSGAEIYLEHAALSEALYTLLVVAALWCAGCSVDSQARRRWLWLGAAGLLVGWSSPVRSIGVFVAPVLIVWAALTVQGRRPRLMAAGAVLLGFCLGLGPYLIYQHSDTGTWGLTRTTGDTLYARTAFFANCADFTPPAGTSGLCQAPVPGENIDFYLYSPASPGVRLFGLPSPSPPHYAWPPDGKLEAFAISAISHQPLTYAWTAIEGLVKYVIPSFGTPAMIGWSHSELIAGLHDPAQEAYTDHAEVASYYPGEPIVHHSIGALDTYADAARVEGPVTAILLVLMIAGFFVSRGRVRLAAGLFGWTTTVMIVVPILLLYYQARYAAPAYGPLAAGGAIGLDQVLERGLLGDLRTRLSPRRARIAASELD